MSVYCHIYYLWMQKKPEWDVGVAINEIRMKEIHIFISEHVNRFLGDTYISLWLGLKQLRQLQLWSKEFMPFYNINVSESRQMVQ